MRKPRAKYAWTILVGFEAKKFAVRRNEKRNCKHMGRHDLIAL